MAQLSPPAGTPKNVSDAECVDWICGLLVSPVIRNLRMESDATHSESLEPVAEVVQGLHSAALPLFGDNRFKNITGILYSIGLLTKVCVDKGVSKEARPSEVRRALDAIGELPTNHGLALALKHGSTGKRIVGFAQSVIAQRQQDTTAAQQWEKAMGVAHTTIPYHTIPKVHVYLY